MAEEMVVKEPLTPEMIEAGKKLTAQLDAAGFPVTASFWWYSLDVGEWRLMIASQIVDSEGPRAAYTVVQSVLKESEIDPLLLALANISVISPEHELVQVLRSAIHTDTGISGIRIKRSWFNNIPIEDAYIYRAA